MSLEELEELSRKVDALKQQCSVLRCLAISDVHCAPSTQSPNYTYLESYISMQQRMRKTGVREEMETVSKRKGVEFLHKQKKELLETIEQLQGEGNDLYDSIEMSMREKEDLMKQLNASVEEVETCKQVIDFLVKERDQMKKEIEIKDGRIVEYTQSFRAHPELMLKAQNPIVHRTVRR